MVNKRAPQGITLLANRFVKGPDAFIGIRDSMSGKANQALRHSFPEVAGGFLW